MEQTTSLKQKIKDGEVVVSLRVAIETDRAQLEDALGKGSYDFIYVDGQHSAFTDNAIAIFCATAEDLGYPVQFRIPHTRNTYLIGRYLDFGLSGILVPEVMEESSVVEAVDYAYYPQFGRRSWGGNARYGLRTWNGKAERLEYAAWWNDHVVLAIQFESIEAISNARALARPGVDYVAFGPNDLRFNLEAHPNYPLQTVDACMQNVAEQLAGTGIRLGMAVTTNPDERGKFLDMGITVFQEEPQ